MGANFEVRYNLREDPPIGGYWHSPSGKYRKFMVELRSRFGLGHDQEERILGPQEGIAKILFDILLRTNHRQVRLRFRGDNFDLVGFGEEGAPAQWLEFTNENGHPHQQLIPRLAQQLITGSAHQQLISGSCPLGFSRSYEALTDIGGIGLEEVLLSHVDLAKAVDTLCTTMDQQDWAQSLLVVIIMLSEAFRYTAIEDFLVENYGKSSTLPPQLRGQLTCGSSSTSVSVRKPSSSPMADDDDFDDDDLDDDAILMGPYMGGKLLAEVFSVRIDHSEEEISLYGTITVEGPWSELYIFNRSEGNPERVGQSKNCTLAGPPYECIEASDGFTFCLDLRSCAGYQVARGTIDWNTYDTSEDDYDTVRSEIVCGENCAFATVSYKVLKKAVQAAVTVVLVESSEAARHVHGEITAYHGNSSDHECLLFKRSWKDPTIVLVERDIPLFRSVIAVPLGSSLTVRVTLKDCGPQKDSKLARHAGADSDIFSHPEVVNGTAGFYSDFSAILKANYTSSEEKFIDGVSGKILVRVTWSDN